jgi:hypothetical protein
MRSWMLSGRVLQIERLKEAAFPLAAYLWAFNAVESLQWGWMAWARVGTERLNREFLEVEGLGRVT